MGDAVVVARLNGRVVGAAGLERYADGALLRSVVVDASAQGHGLGQRLTEAALALARDLCMPSVFLLTTTADGFFPRFGFERIGREDVPNRCGRVSSSGPPVRRRPSSCESHSGEARRAGAQIVPNLEEKREESSGRQCTKRSALTACISSGYHRKFSAISHLQKRLPPNSNPCLPSSLSACL